MAKPSKRWLQILVSPGQHWLGRQGRRWVCGSTIKIDIYSNWHSGLASPGIGHWPAPTLAGCQITPSLWPAISTSDLATASPAQSGQRRNVFAGQWRQWSSVSVTRPRWSLWQCQCWQQPPAGRGPELLSLNFSRPRRRPQRAGGRAPLDTAAPRDFSWTFTTIHYATLSK